MPYLTAAYKDQDHFTCERVLAFRERFMRASLQPTERVPTPTTGIAQEDNLFQSIIQDGKAGKSGHAKPPATSEAP